MTSPERPTSENVEDETKTGLAILPRWSAVYAAVIVSFVAVVMGMWALQSYYS